MEASTPGELVCLYTFYIGNLKGVGKVWQITACDAATSYGVPWLLPVFSAQAAAHTPGSVSCSRSTAETAGGSSGSSRTAAQSSWGVFDEACPAPGDDPPGALAPNSTTRTF